MKAMVLHKAKSRLEWTELPDRRPDPAKFE